MKRYKVIFRYICETCSHFDDTVFFFNTLNAAYRCIKLSLDKLRYDVAFVQVDGFTILKIERRYIRDEI